PAASRASSPPRGPSPPREDRRRRAPGGRPGSSSFSESGGGRAKGARNLPLRQGERPRPFTSSTKVGRGGRRGQAGPPGGGSATGVFDPRSSARRNTRSAE